MLRPRSGGNGRSGTAGSTRLAVDVLVALAERDAAERRAGGLLQAMIDREQLPPRQGVTWLGDPITITIRNPGLALTHSDETGTQADENGSSAGVCSPAAGLERAGPVPRRCQVAGQTPIASRRDRTQGEPHPATPGQFAHHRSAANDQFRGMSQCQRIW